MVGYIFWTISDLLIMIILFYSGVLVTMTLFKNKALQYIIGAIVVAIASPYIAAPINTPLFEFLQKFNVSYHFPITALSAISIIGALAFGKKDY